MENTLENEAKFFAQYWGQEIGHHTFGKHNPRIVNTSYFNQIHWLELTPLSKITDEDAIEVANLQFPVQPLFKKLDEDVILYDTYQYLQSKGYALPFHDLSVEKLVKYGWIKLKED